MIEDVFIIGAGGFAKEVAFLINDINKFEHKYVIKGFITQTIEVINLKIGNNIIPVIEEDYFFHKYKGGISIAMGTGNPILIQKILLKYKDKFKFPNFIHPNFIGDIDNIILGIGNIVTAGNIFTTEIKIGNFNIFNLNITIGHDCIIGDYNVVNPGCEHIWRSSNWNW